MPTAVTSADAAPDLATSVRSWFATCSRGAAQRMRVPSWLADLDPTREVVGWRDARSEERGWLLVPRGDGQVDGIALTRASTRGVPRTATCELCRSTRPAGDVSLFAASRAGVRGRRGDTVGTLVCSDLGCARNVRVLRATLQLQPDPGTTLDEREAGLRERARAFADRVLDRA